MAEPTHKPAREENPEVAGVAAPEEGATGDPEHPVRSKSETAPVGADLLAMPEEADLKANPPPTFDSPSKTEELTISSLRSVDELTMQLDLDDAQNVSASEVTDDPDPEPRHVDAPSDSLADLDEDLPTIARAPGEDEYTPPPGGHDRAFFHHRYELLGRLASGGMAEIFLAKERSEGGLSRHVVIKRVLPDVAGDDQFVRMFLDEARLAMQLVHPHICHIYEFGQSEDTYFIAMEWVNGVSLIRLIRKAREAGGLPIPMVAKLIANVAEALHFAHRATDQVGNALGIIHRDVTPQNIMVSYDGAVKLLDFGIAKATSHANQTHAGVVKGKLAYMSPQQCLGEDIDLRTDIFALGICFWEALAGRPLYVRGSAHETVNAIVNEAPPSLRGIREDIPEALEAIVMKALAKDPDERFSTAGELHHAIEEWIASERHVMTSARVSDYLGELFREDIAKGPMVDAIPVGPLRRRVLPTIDSSGEPHGRSHSSRPPRSGAEAPRHDSTSPESPRHFVRGPTMPHTLQGQRRDGAPSWLVFVGGTVIAALIGLLVAVIFFGAPPQSQPAPVAAVPAVVPPPPAPIPEPPPKVAKLTVQSRPAGAKVTVDGEALEGLTPIDLDKIESGKHVVKLELEGYEGWDSEVELRVGERTRVDARLRKTAAPPPAKAVAKRSAASAPGPTTTWRPPSTPTRPAATPPKRVRSGTSASSNSPARAATTAPKPTATATKTTGKLSINTRPWSRVYLGNRALGITPVAGVELPAGPQNLGLVDSKGQSHSKRVTVKAGGTTNAFFDLSNP